MSENHSGIKAAKKRQEQARRRRLQRRKRKRQRAMLLGGMFCIACLIIFGSIYGISHLIHKKNATTETAKSSQQQTTEKKVKSDTTAKKDKVDTSSVDVKELVINTDKNSKNSKSSDKKKESTSITISSMGDCTLGTDENFDKSTSLNAYYNEYGADYFFKNVRSILEADDLSIVNFEGTLTEETSRADKTFAFKAPAEYASILSGSSVEAANVANNHSKDYGTKSLEDTITNLSNAGIAPFGYENVVVLDVKGIKVGLTGIYELAEHEKKAEQVKENIQALKDAGAQIIIVNFHWGVEKEYTPNATQKSLAHLAIDEGADLVIGHHPHVLEGIEKYKGKYIAYSLGNFCFGGNKNPSDKDTMIFQQTFTIDADGKVSDDDNINIIPCSLSSSSSKNDYCPTPLSGDEADRVKKKIEKYSEGL